MIVQGLPHACGGVSSFNNQTKWGTLSSPRMWGCFLRRNPDPKLKRVFPTHVGVFLTQRLCCGVHLGLPHACGGVSIGKIILRENRESSPRMWGCFSTITASYMVRGVFPTHVGVFLVQPSSHPPFGRLPHACGGVSVSRWKFAYLQRSSPRMWGCFHPRVAIVNAKRVFPTHVGVFLIISNWGQAAACLPHACGGVSNHPGPDHHRALSSPRMWGCFPILHARSFSESVFPTHVGVFLSVHSLRFLLCGLPHACGGVSDRLRQTAHGLLVFPTHVGVFLGHGQAGSSGPRLPHACGGVSPPPRSSSRAVKSSPRMWGCFFRRLGNPGGRFVFPTHVGVFPDTDARARCFHSLPHACGGVSMCSSKRFLFPQSSPRMWGCFPGKVLDWTNGSGLPHACGGVSGGHHGYQMGGRSSPRMWGCFCGLSPGHAPPKVFPTHVGVFPHVGAAFPGCMCLPHACGGVSSGPPVCRNVRMSSPRMWGCFRDALVRD